MAVYDLTKTKKCNHGEAYRDIFNHKYICVKCGESVIEVEMGCFNKYLTKP